MPLDVVAGDTVWEAVINTGRGRKTRRRPSVLSVANVEKQVLRTRSFDMGSSVDAPTHVISCDQAESTDSTDNETVGVVTETLHVGLRRSRYPSSRDHDASSEVGAATRIDELSDVHVETEIGHDVSDTLEEPLERPLIGVSIGQAVRLLSGKYVGQIGKNCSC